MQYRKKTDKYSYKTGTDCNFGQYIALLSVLTFFSTNENFDLTNALNSKCFFFIKLQILFVQKYFENTLSCHQNPNNYY